jgi:hypothetical protein
LEAAVQRPSLPIHWMGLYQHLAHSFPLVPLETGIHLARATKIKTSWEMSAEHNTLVVFTLLLSLNVKFMISFQKNIQHFNTARFIHMLVTDIQSVIIQDTVIGEIYNCCQTLTIMLSAQLTYSASACTSHKTPCLKYEEESWQKIINICSLHIESFVWF